MEYRSLRYAWRLGMNDIYFLIVILLTNIIQGITGFAGTILAMPLGIMLVGFDVAKPVLNVLGLLAGGYVFITQRQHVKWKELKKIVIIMTGGMLAGFFLKTLSVGKEGALFKCLGIFVIVLAVLGIYQLWKDSRRIKEEAEEEPQRGEAGTGWKSYLLLIGSGIVHGMFVSGGPLLIAYLSKTVKEKISFRATISTVWIFLNMFILIEDIKQGLWDMSLLKIQAAAVPFLIVGMVIGTKLYKSMSQIFFMKLTYVLLIVSGIVLLTK